MKQTTSILSDMAVKRMLAYHERLKAHQGPFGTSVTKPGYMPYVEHEEIVNEFEQLAYEDDWLLPGYDWVEQRELLASEGFIEQASMTDIRKAFTYAIRSNRFCEGNLVLLFEVGVIQRLLERLEVLAKTGK